MKTVNIDGIEYVEKQQTSDLVLVRTYSAGVHFGKLESRNGKEVTLTNARRLWSWQGACSLSQVATDGVDLSDSKISVPVPLIVLTEAIEIISMSPQSSKQLSEAPAWKK